MILRAVEIHRRDSAGSLGEQRESSASPGANDDERVVGAGSEGLDFQERILTDLREVEPIVDRAKERDATDGFPRTRSRVRFRQDAHARSSHS